MNEMEFPYDDTYRDMYEERAMTYSKQVLAMAYVPDQTWETPYDVAVGIHRGTLFPRLDKPFLGGGNRE